MTDSAKSHFYWFLRRNERDVVGLYQFMWSYVQYATGTCMLNFGYWLKGNFESIGNAQYNLCTLTGKFAELHSAKIIIDVGSGFCTPAVQWELRYDLLDKIICVDINYKELGTASKNIDKVFSYKNKNIEISPRTYVTHGNGNHKKDIISLVNATATILPFPDHFADRIIALDSAQHFKSINQFISESSRVLKHGGLLVIAIPVVTTERQSSNQNILIKTLKSIRQLGILTITWASEHYQLEYIKKVILNENFRIKQIEYIGASVYAPLADYYIRNRMVFRRLILNKYPSYSKKIIYDLVERIVYVSALKMRELSQKGTIDYVLIKASRSSNKISQ